MNAHALPSRGVRTGVLGPARTSFYKGSVVPVQIGGPSRGAARSPLGRSVKITAVIDTPPPAPGPALQNGNGNGNGAQPVVLNTAHLPHDMAAAMSAAHATLSAVSADAGNALHAALSHLKADNDAIREELTHLRHAATLTQPAPATSTSGLGNSGSSGSLVNCDDIYSRGGKVKVNLKIADAKATALHLKIKVVSETTDTVFHPVSLSHFQRSDCRRPIEKEPGSEFIGTIDLPANFGTPGAIFLTKEPEVLKEIGAKVDALLGKDALPSDDRVYVDTVELGDKTFHCHSWVDITQGDRVFFTSQARLPQDTPKRLQKLRQQELYVKQGKDAPNVARSGADRIYDYDTYRDLGDPDKSPDLARPVLGGPDLPYPRRMKTNRKPANDGITESRPPNGSQVPWVPLDEAFDEVKQTFFVGAKQNGIYAAIPSLAAEALTGSPHIGTFDSYAAYDALYNMGDRNQHSGTFLGKVKEFLWGKIEAAKFMCPRIRMDRPLDWNKDEEMGRMLFAGQNPNVVFQVKPDWLATTAFKDEQVVGLLEGKSLTERVAEGARIFAVDHFPVFEKWMDAINSQEDNYMGGNDTLKKQRYQHAIRGLYYKKDCGDVVPVAYQVKWKGNGESEVFTPYDEAELWCVVKSVFSSVDSAYQAAYSHFTLAHACMEAYIIPTHRTLSAMHPVFKLMEPHCRYTMNIGAAARMQFLAPNTVIEGSFTTGMYTWTLTADVYGALWTFEGQNFEKNLHSRGMLKTDASGEPIRVNGRVQPLVPYPYADDGLDVWYAFSSYFDEYLNIYYSDDAGSGRQVTDDLELLNWWDEVQHKAHPDIKKGWPALRTITDLRDILTTIAWTATAHHAAVGNGNLDYTGYMPVTPTTIRRPIPKRGSKELQALKQNFEQELFSYLTAPLDTLQIIIFSLVVSAHSPGEEYINDDRLKWIQDAPAVRAHLKFVQAMKDMDMHIAARNASKTDKIRADKAIPYIYLIPSAQTGITSSGIAQSVSY